MVLMFSWHLTLVHLVEEVILFCHMAIGPLLYSHINFLGHLSHVCWRRCKSSLWKKCDVLSVIPFFKPDFVRVDFVMINYWISFPSFHILQVSLGLWIVLYSCWRDDLICTEEWKLALEMSKSLFNRAAMWKILTAGLQNKR